MKMKKIQNEQIYETSDLAIGATLHCLGYQLDHIEKGYSNRATFSFVVDDDIDEVIQDFWAHSLKVDPLSYFSSMKEMKTRMYST